MASLQKFLRDADERVREAAAKALNEAAAELKQEVLKNMDKQKIKNPTGNLRSSIEATLATPEDVFVMIKSEVYAKMPKQPGKFNPAMRGRYRRGVPYGRIIEFGRPNKPFFYTAWYNKRKEIKEKIITIIGNAWSGKS